MRGKYAGKSAGISIFTIERLFAKCIGDYLDALPQLTLVERF